MKGRPRPFLSLRAFILQGCSIPSGLAAITARRGSWPRPILTLVSLPPRSPTSALPLLFTLLSHAEPAAPGRGGVNRAGLASAAVGWAVPAPLNCICLDTPLYPNGYPCSL